MAPTHTDTVRGIYERWAEGDFNASLDVLDPHFVLIQGPDFPDTGTYIGPDELRRYMLGFLEPWERITIAADEIVEAGDSVVVAVTQRGLGSASGAETEFRYFHVWTFRGARAIRVENFRERGEAYDAVGLSGT